MKAQWPSTMYTRMANPHNTTEIPQYLVLKFWSNSYCHMVLIESRMTSAIWRSHPTASHKTMLFKVESLGITWGHAGNLKSQNRKLKALGWVSNIWLPACQFFWSQAEVLWHSSQAKHTASKVILGYLLEETKHVSTKKKWLEGGKGGWKEKEKRYKNVHGCLLVVASNCINLNIHWHNKKKCSAFIPKNTLNNKIN